MCVGKILDLSKDTSHIENVEINILLSRKIIDTIIKERRKYEYGRMYRIFKCSQEH